MAQEKLPKHIAIIMDGNGRWAKQRHMPRVAGHHAGVEAVRATVKFCVEKKIGVLTLFAFSSENWQRPAKEVSYLMELFLAALEREVKKLHKQNVQLRIVGDYARFDARLRASIVKAQTLTAENTGLKLIIAANYGGKWDICTAVQRLLTENQDKNPAELVITPELLASKLALADLPDPDLFIRTSGEQRISNFLLWQLAYAELYFTETLWPDFNAHELEQALDFFANRERRFGHISEQLGVPENA